MKSSLITLVSAISIIVLVVYQSSAWSGASRAGNSDNQKNDNAETTSDDSQVKPDLSHPELGRVKWLRDLSRIQLVAAKENKPIFMLFQEVPG